MKQQITILEQSAIARKLLRMAFQLWEYHSKETSITLIGIEGSGMVITRQLAKNLEEISPLKVHVHTVHINKKRPLSEPIVLNTDLNGKSVVLVDDVANSGKTLMYALKPILASEPVSVRVAVLIDRKHKFFPIIPDIVGHTIATTLRDHIQVICDDHTATAAYLE